MPIEIVTQELATLTCWECGIAYCVPLIWARNKSKHESKREDAIICPNGHENRYHFPAPQKDLEAENAKLLEENESLKLRLFKALHDAEQSEARGQDIELSAVDEVDAAGRPSAGQDASGSVLINAQGHLQCPVCAKGLPTCRGFVIHFRRMHPDDPRCDDANKIAFQAIMRQNHQNKD